MDTHPTFEESFPEAEMMEFFETGRLEKDLLRERTAESLFPAFKSVIEEAAKYALAPDYIESIRADCTTGVNTRIFAIRSKLIQMAYRPESVEFIKDQHGFPLQIRKSVMAEVALPFVERKLFAA